MTKDEFETLVIGDQIADGAAFQSGYGTVVAIDPDDDYPDCPILVTVDFGGCNAHYLSTAASRLYKRKKKT